MAQITSIEEMKANVEVLARMTLQLDAARNELERINKDEQLLGKEMSKYPLLTAMFQAKDPYDKLWTNALNFTIKNEEWVNGPCDYQLSYSSFNIVVVCSVI